MAEEDCFAGSGDALEENQPVGFRVFFRPALCLTGERGSDFFQDGILCGDLVISEFVEGGRP